MQALVRLSLGTWVTLSALLLGCSDEPGSGSTTKPQGGAAGSAGSNQGGTISLGGSASGAAGSAGSAGSSAGKGGSSAGAGGGQSGSSSAGSPAQGGQGGSSIFEPESAGSVLATVDGEKLSFDQTRLSRQVAENQYSVQARMKSGGNRNFIFRLSLFNGPGTYDCVNNLISLSNAAGETANATASNGSCSMTFTELPTAEGGALKGTFTATLQGAAATVTITDGSMDLKAPI